MNSFEIIKTVRVTEKGTLQSDKFNQYTLVVDRRANAQQVKRAVQDLFRVTVLRVNTMVVPGKSRRKGTKAAGMTSEWKKAIVTLKAKDKISLT